MRTFWKRGKTDTEKREVLNAEKVRLPEDLVLAFAKFLVPEARAFYESDRGRAYYRQWLKHHGGSEPASTAMTG